jgi:uncharacterized protein (DUF983 family)
MTEPRGAAETIRCPVCDKEPTLDRPLEVAHSEPATHCEWCGAEYPLPDSADPAPTAPAVEGGEDGQE